MLAHLGLPTCRRAEMEACSFSPLATSHGVMRGRVGGFGRAMERWYSSTNLLETSRTQFQLIILNVRQDANTQLESDFFFSTENIANEEYCSRTMMYIDTDHFNGSRMFF